jgi:aspartyl-tRNA(Asn)/glutamyl-tRNA(Gln) amidotransferase subunit A
VIGPIARTVEDTRLIFDVISGPDARDRSSLFIPAPEKKLLRVLYVPRFGDSPLDPEIAHSVDAAARVLEQFCELETGAMPLDLGPLNDFWPRFGAAGVAYVMAMHPGKENLLGPRFQAMLELGRKVTAAEYLTGFELFERLRRESESVFERWDLVMTPSAAALPWPAEQPYPEVIDGKKVGPRGHAIYTGWVNACGIPAINLPCAPSRAGMPIGFQLAARFGADRLLLELAEKYEQASPWCDRWPEIALARE